MLIRVRAPNGALRFELAGEQPVADLYAAVGEKMQLAPSAFALTRDQPGRETVPPLGAIAASGIKHGDQLFFHTAKGTALPELFPEGNKASAESREPVLEPVIEDTVDVELYKKDGLIYREAPEGNPKRMRLEDLPLAPYDEGYLAEHRIKHMSYHAMVRKLMDASKNSGLTGRVSILDDGVAELVRRVNRPPDATGLRVKDMPGAIQIARQDFRMVDHVEFEDSNIINNFLNAWRSTGNQRFGYLFGKYAPYTEVPLGIKAVVSFVYEPPQVGGRTGVQLSVEDPHLNVANGIAQLLGMRLVGMIFTDLTDDGTGTGKVLFKRNAETFFLSSAEAYMSARMQLMAPSPCRLAGSGTFGSKFVTVVATGDENGAIDLQTYQVSNQAMALVASESVVPTEDPSLVQVVLPDPESGRIIPDVYFTFVNKYGTKVKERARPNFPVEFLLVKLTDGFPKEAHPLLNANPTFPVEHREGPPVHMRALYAHFKAHGNDVMRALSDFHALLFIAENNLFDMTRDFATLCEAVRDRDAAKMEAVKGTDSWKTMTMVMQAAG